MSPPLHNLFAFFVSDSPPANFKTPEPSPRSQSQVVVTPRPLSSPKASPGRISSASLAKPQGSPLASLHQPQAAPVGEETATTSSTQLPSVLSPRGM